MRRAGREDKMALTERTLSVIVAVSRDVADALDELRDVFEELDRRAAVENLNVRIDDQKVSETDNAQFFYRESPAPLIERIRLELNPDVIICVFHKRFGAAEMEPPPDVERELAEASERWRQPGHPQVLLYFLERPSEPRDQEEGVQQDYFARFRGFEPLRDYWWFYKRSPPLRRAPRGKELRMQARNHLWEMMKRRAVGATPYRRDPPPELNLENTGWEYITPEYLAEFRSALGDGSRLSREEALDYFDGKEPTWKIAVSSSVHPREIVQSLVREVAEAAGRRVLRVTLLTGPGGEGKSTILHQAAVSLAENYPGPHVIWRREATNSLDPSVITHLLKSKGHFVIIADNAETIADDVYERVSSLKGRPSSNIQFLLASRGTDWQWRQGASFSKWFKALGNSNFIQRPVRRLEEGDAARVVRAWEELGDEGLGNLSEEPEERRPQILFQRAQAEWANVSGRGEEGSFFGAILRTRKSKTLDAFVQGILDRLRDRAAPGGKTLEEIFAYIVTPHADNLYILSKPVLRHLLSCSADTLHREVIEPLADEAATDAHEWFVLARHRMVAEKAKELLRTKYPEVKIYSDLLEAAIGKIKAKDGELSKEDSERWNNLARSLLEIGRKELAVHIAEKAAEIEQDDPYPVVAWANILRKLNRHDEAAALFTRRYDKIKEKKNRAYFFEWGVSLREAEDYLAAVWLCGISLSDWVMANEWHPKYVPLMMRFAELSISLTELYKKASDPNSALHDPADAQTFLYACAAAAELGLNPGAQKDMPQRFDWQKSERSLRKAKQFAAGEGAGRVEPRDAIQQIHQVIVLAGQLCAGRESELSRSLPAAGALTFAKLSASLGINAKHDPQGPPSNFTRPL